MEVNNSILKRIIKECCRSLSYSDEERQFSFPLATDLDYKWKSLRNYIQEIHPDYHLSDFNELLSRLSDLTSQYRGRNLKSIFDTQLLNGEVLEVSFSEEDELSAIRLVRMKSGQYLNCESGKGLSLGTAFRFVIGSELVTSEGKRFGQISSIMILEPDRENIVLSRVLIGNYYKNGISESLWPLYDKAVGNGIPESKSVIENYLLMAKESGIQSFPLLLILNSVARQWR